MSEKALKSAEELIDFIREKALRIRRHIIKMTAEAGSGHPGGSLSAADILATLYFGIMRHDPSRPDWPERDRLYLSKGHASPLLYACLAEAGYFPIEDLWTFRKLGSHCQGHPSIKTPGVEVGSGSLGHGLSIALGTALGLRLLGTDATVYCVMGDGENQEGSVWEAAMAAGHYRAGNLIAFVDYNRLQIDGNVEDVMGLEPLPDKYRAFRWHVQEIDGHDIGQIIKAVEASKEETDRPSVIIAHTIKGKGVSFMEGVAGWHGKAPDSDEAEKALKDLGED